ncbi:ankyrin, partial [Anaeromyces robustus]
INEIDNHGYNILHYAILKEDIETINYLIENGADINFGNNTAITIALSIGNKEIFYILINSLENGANVNFTTDKGNSILNYAIKKKSYPIIEFLIKNGSKVNIKN